MRTVGDVVIQGEVSTGTQGAGVKTPRARAVKEITIGLAGELHIPKGGTFSMGIKSVIFPAGIGIKTLGKGKELNTLGAIPKLHNVWPVEHDKGQGIKITPHNYFPYHFLLFQKEP